MRRNSVVVLLLIISLLTIILGSYYKKYSSEEETLNRIINEQGYFSNVKDRGVSFEVLVKDEWIPKPGAENIINYKINEINKTDIMLRKVMNRDKDIVFDFEAITHTAENKYKGEFLSLVEKLDNGNFVSYGPVDEWKFLNNSGVDLIYGSKQIGGYGSGEGPGNQFAVNLDKEYEHLLRDELTIKFSGFILYEYERK